jgi:hypothetical protein
LTYAEHARDYDRLTHAFTGVRRVIVEALPLFPGEVVLHVGCGTGLCLPMLRSTTGCSSRSPQPTNPKHPATYAPHWPQSTDTSRTT